MSLKPIENVPRMHVLEPRILKTGLNHAFPVHLEFDVFKPSETFLTGSPSQLRISVIEFIPIFETPSTRK